MTNKRKVWVVTGNSESGDDYGPYVFNDKPSDKVLKKLVKDEMDWNGPDGPGDYGGYTYLKIEECVVGAFCFEKPVI